MEPLRDQHAAAASGDGRVKSIRDACRAFGIEPARVRALSGDDLNSTYRVWARDGGNYCLKVHTGPPTEARLRQLEWTGSLQFRLRETGYDAPTPQKTAGDNSTCFMTSQHLLTVAAWTPGRRLPPGPGGGPSRRVIETVADFHQAASKHLAMLLPEPVAGMRSWAASLELVAADHPVRRALSSSEWLALLARLDDDLAALSQLPQVIIHGDARTPNVVANGDSCRLIDWELAPSAPAIFDLATDALWRAWLTTGARGIAEAVNVYANRRGALSDEEIRLLPTAMRVAALRDVSLVTVLDTSEVTGRLLDFAKRRLSRSQEQLSLNPEDANGVFK
jgi:Ser/Thr protein kinase RdoA (MazF antagonist)